MFPQRIAVNSSDKEDEFLNNDHNSHDHENDDETGNNININNNLFIDYQLKRRSSRAAYSSNEKDEGGGYTVNNDKQHSTKRSLKTSLLGPQGHFGWFPRRFHRICEFDTCCCVLFLRIYFSTVGLVPQGISTKINDFPYCL